MRILYVTQAQFSGSSGEATHSREMVRAFCEIGHSVDVLCSQGAKGLGVNSCSEFSSGAGGIGRSVFQLWLLWRLLFASRRRYDLIYVRHASLMFAPSLMKRLIPATLMIEFNTIFSRTLGISIGARGRRLIERA